ncbi:MAG TPA: ABC transporter ATP-binding protein [Acidimicrobiales bacterium]|nr:ABC transporter ATP-binding protein [Acidimicrobiales bacterium]
MRQTARQAGTTAPLLDVRHVERTFVVNTPGQGRRKIQAVADVSFDIWPGETVALVGETGCGKSTLARSILQLPRPEAGEVVFKGADLVQLRHAALRNAMQGMQVVFQDPFSSLNPRWNVLELVGEPLAVHDVGTKQERTRRVEELLEAVGLDARIHGRRRPRELSGGQCQRVAIARALTLSPNLMVCDEAVSSLDVSIQAQILNLFEDLRTDFDLSYLFITHDLSVARHMSDRIAVMYLGKIVELAPSTELFSNPLHPYSAALLSSMPHSDGTATPDRIRLTGDIPSAANPPSGCRFRTRCPFAQQLCADVEPPLNAVSEGRQVACHFPLERHTAAAAPAGTRVD